MGLLAWLRLLLCGSGDALRGCLEEAEALRGSVKGLEGSVAWYRGEVDRLRRVIVEEHTARVVAEADATRFYAELGRSIRVPDIAPVLEAYPCAVVDPWVMTQAQWRGVTPVMISDLEYLAPLEEAWLRILAPIQVEVKRVLGFPKQETNDCDNWSMAMCFMVQEAFRRAEARRQAAFLRLESRVHAYCGFMMPDYTVRVYEPLNGRVVGWLGETGPGDYGEATYRTERAMFLS